MTRLRRAACPPVLALTALLTLSPLAAGPAVAGHVSPRSIDDACPADQVEGGGYRDTAGTTFAFEIDCVSDYSIARGFGDGRYAPEATVTRAQMAKFLFRLVLSAHLPRDSFLVAPDSGYHDVNHLDPDTRDAINAVSYVGIARGLTAERFGPAEPVTRAQMATFLSRLHAQATETDGFPPGPDAFGDDDGLLHEPAINAIAAAGIATGLGGEQDRLFGPGRPLTRGQMAGFLARLLDAEVEARTIGSTYAEPERVEGTFVYGERYPHPNEMLLDTDGDGRSDRLLYFDGNDDYLFGDTPGSFEDVYASLSEGDRVRADHAPNVFDRSTFALLDDQVLPPYVVLATVLVGDDGVQDDVRVVWDFGRDTDIVERLRAQPGTDGVCGTVDDAPYVAAGTVDGERGRSGVLRPQTPDVVHPVVVDTDREPGSCYRYQVRAVSDRVPGSTPSEPSPPSNSVAVDGTVDDEAPELTAVETVPDDRDGSGTLVRYVFGNEDAVAPSGVFVAPGAFYLQCRAGKNGYQDPMAVVAAAGAGSGDDTVTTDAEDADLSLCDPSISVLAAVDEKGNPSATEQFPPPS